MRSRPAVVPRREQVLCPWSSLLLGCYGYGVRAGREIQGLGSGLRGPPINRELEPAWVGLYGCTRGGREVRRHRFRRGHRDCGGSAGRTRHWPIPTRELKSAVRGGRDGNRAV